MNNSKILFLKDGMVHVGTIIKDVDTVSCIVRSSAFAGTVKIHKSNIITNFTYEALRFIKENH